MNKLEKIVQNEKKIKTYFDFLGDVDISLQEGMHVDYGDRLYTREGMDIVDAYYLPREFNIHKATSKDYICRLPGEYVSEGEVIAEKIGVGGLSTNKIVAKTEGIISFDRIEEGYIDIKSEKRETTVYSTVAGIVSRIDLQQGIEIASEALSLNIFKASVIDKEEEAYMTGVRKYSRLSIIKDGSSIYSIKDLDETYEDTVLFCGRHVYREFALEAIKRGCSALMVYSIDYQDYLTLSKFANIIILGGFGNIPIPTVYVNMLNRLAGMQIQYEPSEDFGKVVFLNTGFTAEQLINSSIKGIFIQTKVKEDEIERYNATDISSGRRSIYDDHKYDSESTVVGDTSKEVTRFKAVEINDIVRIYEPLNFSRLAIVKDIVEGGSHLVVGFEEGSAIVSTKSVNVIET